MTKEAAQKWELTERMVQYHCKAGRIYGAVKLSGVWLIPKEAKKPDDERGHEKGLKNESNFIVGR